MALKLNDQDVANINAALSRITECSDALYRMLQEPGKLGAESRGFTPSHTLNGAVGLIRNALFLARERR